jgi:acyl dehydratase
MNLEVGQTARRDLAVTTAMIRSYAEITGDYNPLHFDEEFAAGTRFERLIAQGGITTGLIHALVAMDMPGPGTVFLDQNWLFPKPVYIGDTITAKGTVTAIDERRRIRMSFEVTNQDGVTVLKGDATVMQFQPST